MTFDPVQELVRRGKTRTGCEHHPPIDRRSVAPAEAAFWHNCLEQCSPDARWHHERFLGRNDLFYLLNYILEVPKLGTPWHHERCDEVEKLNDHVLDLWTRGAGKSAIKTYGKVIQEILKNPDICFGLFSHVRPLGKELLRKIKTTFEGHERLKALYPDILWEKPEVEAPVWSLDHGITVKRKSVTRGEATVEAWGLVDGQPTGRHYDVIVYDDIQKEKISEYMIDQIEAAFDTSMGLGATKPTAWWMVGVFFRGGSIYERLIERDVGLPRIRPAMFPDGTSPIYTDEQVRAVIKSVKPGVLACEYLMDPTRKEEGEGFREEWLRYHDGVDLKSSHVYILVDPGQGGKKKGTGSPCAIAVIATRADRKFYLLDGLIARLPLSQRADWVIAFHRQYQPKKVLYEKFGMQADIEYLKERVKRDGYFPEGGFSVVPLSAPIDKDERIEWLVPLFREGRIYLPRSIPEREVNGEKINVLDYFLHNEYRIYPATKHKDFLDCLAWSQWRDSEISFPEGYDDISVSRQTPRDDLDRGEAKGSWMAE